MKIGHNQPKLTLEGEWYRRRDEMIRALAKWRHINTTARLVGVHVAMNIGRQKGEMWHQQETIAADLGLSVGAVKLALRALRRDNILSARKAQKSKGKRAVNHYAFNEPWLWEETPSEGQNSAPDDRQDSAP